MSGYPISQWERERLIGLAERSLSPSMRYLAAQARETEHGFPSREAERALNHIMGDYVVGRCVCGEFVLCGEGEEIDGKLYHADTCLPDAGDGEPDSP